MLEGRREGGREAQMVRWREGMAIELARLGYI